LFASAMNNSTNQNVDYQNKNLATRKRKKKFKNWKLKVKRSFFLKFTKLFNVRKFFF
jgi:hypothetical protein